MTTRVDYRQIVLTYSEDGWPVGLLTGQETREGAFYLRHVVVFPGAPAGTLDRLLRAGIEEAWAQTFSSIVFCIPDDFRLGAVLKRLGRRLGFICYHQEEGTAWFVKYK